MQKGDVPVAFSSDTKRAIPSPALLPCGQQGPTPADGPLRNSRPTAPERCIYLMQPAEKVFVKLVIMNIFRKFSEAIDNQNVLYKIVLYQTNKN